MKVLMIALSALLLSCGGTVTKDDLLPDANGEHGHVLIIMQDDLWAGKIQTALVEQLDQTAKGPYLRKEPMFDFFRKESEDLNHVNKMSRLILKVMIDFDSTYQETALIDKRNYYAKGQIFLVVKDSDPDRLYDYIKNDFGHVLDLLNDFEMEQMISEFKSRPNAVIKEKAEKNFGFSLYLPRDSKLKVAENDFMWSKYERSRNILGSEANGTHNETYWIQEGILLWSEPISDSSQFVVEDVMNKRDTVLKHNVAGKVEGSYMATEYDSAYAPASEIIQFQGRSCIVVRGLWKHDGHPGAFGGGPFVQYSMIDEASNKIVTVCGYVYAPKFNKREYIREIEAMLNTIEFL